MSTKEIKFIDNIVDKKVSEYYYHNKRFRNFWHSRSVTISCRVREKNAFNKGLEISKNIRAFLLGEDTKFLETFNKIANSIRKRDLKIVENYCIFRGIDNGMSKEKAKKNVGLIARSLEDGELRKALNLEYVISCRLLGYEKEFFYLKCYSRGEQPVFVMRVLYHTGYDHSNGKYMEILNEKIEFEELVRKIKFL